MATDSTCYLLNHAEPVQRLPASRHTFPLVGPRAVDFFGRKQRLGVSCAQSAHRLGARIMYGVPGIAQLLGGRDEANRTLAAAPTDMGARH